MNDTPLRKRKKKNKKYDHNREQREKLIREKLI